MIVLFSRIAWLFALGIAPLVPSPEPSVTAVWLALLGALLLALPPLYAGWLARSYGAFEAKVAFLLLISADAMIAWKASSTLSEGVPLMAGYYVIAVPLWAGLAALAATIAGQYLGTSFKNKRMGAAIATIAIGFFVFRDAHELVASHELQWRSVLRGDPTHKRALSALPPEYFDSPEGRGRIEACLLVDSSNCFCRLHQAEHELARDQINAALIEAQTASCEGSAQAGRQRELLAVTLALSGRTAEAEALAEAGLAERPESPRLLYAAALVASQRGDADKTIALATQAASSPAGVARNIKRGAQLLQAATEIGKGDRESAKNVLSAMAKETPDDADVVYNLALIADQEGDFNGAREGYLKALKLRPQLRGARYNLALLTLRFGATDEARHHAKRFVESFPDDARGPALLARIGN